MSPETFRWVLTGFLTVFGLMWGAIGTLLFTERQNTRENFKDLKDKVEINHDAIHELREGLVKEFVLRTEYIHNVGRIEARLDGVKERLDRHLGQEEGV